MCLEGGFSPFWARFLAPDKFLGLFLKKILPVAGLGLFFHKSARALAPRGLLESAYDFLCLISTKSPSQGIVESPRAVLTSQGDFGDIILYTKT
jgi:hypothetical protein